MALLLVCFFNVLVGPSAAAQLQRTIESGSNSSSGELSRRHLLANGLGLTPPWDSMSWWEGVDETRLLVAPEPSVTGKCGGQLLSLRHPKSGNSTCFLLINGGLQEIHWFKQSYGSWFVGDYVCEGLTFTWSHEL
ncbi:hypothetical protein RHMOL_Rhmol07G0221300 [Rhododendron molle]|uniref:Uncharacterized protein n=1 Tax=Rhododendron molle TaxID=49168 RepID=A0ACC0N3S9_RHOML|nr:hypothetical protein RHMOL_Rhmol07G0221300 [Rhododendron molle]